MDSTATRLANYRDELKLRGFPANQVHALVADAAQTLVMNEGLRVANQDVLDALRQASEQPPIDMQWPQGISDQLKAAIGKLPRYDDTPTPSGEDTPQG